MNIGRENKYITKNPIGRYLIDNFFNQIDKMLTDLSFQSVLDAGCGEGLLLGRMKKYIKGKKVFGIDIDPLQIKMAKKNIPFGNFTVADIYKMPFKKQQFDLVLCTEVLEHIDKPNLALGELSRVTKKYCILSVPNEPIWRILNLLRGAYIRDFGNTEGHISHWSSNSFQKLAGKYFKVIKAVTPLPWTVLLCSP